jgi:undecaprenyl-diphosphatase
MKPYIRFIVLVVCIVFVTSSIASAGLVDNSLDTSLFRLVNKDLKGNALDSGMRWASRLANPPTVACIPLALYITGNQRQQQTALVMASALMRSMLATELIKNTVARPRPGLNLSDVNFNGAILRDTKSFPSGHTVASFTIATILANEYPDHSIPLYLLATTVGVSRIYNGMHFPSDVIVGAIIGYMFARDALENKEQITAGNIIQYTFSF